jgi:hypothetical protein
MDQFPSGGPEVAIESPFEDANDRIVKLAMRMFNGKIVSDSDERVHHSATARNRRQPKHVSAKSAKPSSPADQSQAELDF